MLAFDGRLEEALAIVDAAEERFRAAGNAEGEASALMERGLTLWDMGRYERAATQLQAAVTRFSAAGRELSAADARIELAKLERLRRDPHELEQWLRSALAVALEAGNLGLVSDAHSALGVVLLRDDRRDEAERSYRTAIDIARRIDNTTLLLDPLPNLGNLLIGQGRWDEARPLLEEAAERAGAARRTTNRAAALIGQARAGEGSGDLDSARRIYEELIATAGEDPADRMIVLAGVRLARVDQWQGRLQAALDRADRAVAAYRGLSLSRDLVTALIRRAKIRSAMGQRAEAERDREEIQEILGRDGKPGASLRRNHAITRVELLFDQGRWSDALAVIDADLDPERPDTDRLRCEVLVRLGRHDSATAPCRRAVETVELPMPHRIEARRFLAEALLDAGDGGAALSEAHVAYDGARAADLPLALAGAAVVLVRGGAADAPEVRREGLGALDGYLASVPDADRERLLRVRDLGRLQSSLRNVERG